MALLLSNCSSSKTKQPAEEGAAAPFEELQESAPKKSSKNSDVVDPAAPSGHDNFPAAAIASDKEEAAEPRPNALAPGFLIRLGHQEDRDLNGTFRIDFDGKISLPYNITFKAEGLTMEEFRAKVMESYRPFYKNGLRLTVELVEKSYFIEMRGLIVKPGKYRVRTDASLDEVISLGGGFPPAPVMGTDNTPKFLKITRGPKTRVVNLDEYYKSGSLRSTLNWHGGEILFFQRESSYTSEQRAVESGTQVQVLGELKRPGEFAYRPEADIYFYLTEAGGPTRDADFTKVQVYRGPAGKRVMQEFSMEDPEKAPKVLAGDIIVFQSDKLTPFQKNASTWASIASVLTSIVVLIIAL